MFSVIENLDIKNKCQVFTPLKHVSQMLDLASYNINLYGKKFLENSCGNGEILVQAIIRYIEDCKRKRFSRNKIKKGLENDFIAYEVDILRIDECRSRLNAVAAKYKIRDVSWDIRCEDYLASKTNELFDYIVGNPPYIAYPDLPVDVQNFVKKNFVSCKKGKFDYSYAFIEKSYSQLKISGKLVYIIPSNIFKNVFAFELRELIKNDIESIDDFPIDTVFKNVLVSPAIIKIVKELKSDCLLYKIAKTEKKIPKNTLGVKWFFNDIFTNSGMRVGDFYKVSSSVATLLNEAFIVKNGVINNEYYELGDKKIELSLLKKAASPKNKKYRKNNEFIIFPYFYDSKGILQHYSEEEMYAKFPFAMQYLETYKTKLNKRDADQNSKWFEYGRSQALQNINQKLILISSIISDCTEPYILDIDEVPYSGLYIVPTDKYSIDSLMPILKAVEFKNYIKAVGVCVSGTSKRVSPKDIENYIYKGDQ